jgi:hypothetical protein
MPECIGIVEPWTVPDDSTTSPAMIVSRRLSTSSTPIKHRRDRYATESARLLGVLDERLAGRDWVMGADDSIADIRCSAGCATSSAFTKRASSSASIAFFTCSPGSTAVPRCRAGRK